MIENQSINSAFGRYSSTSLQTRSIHLLGSVCLALATAFVPAAARGASVESAVADEPAPPPRPDKDPRGIFSVSVENDIFADTDQHYTNGIRISYLSAESDVPEWLDHVAAALPMFAVDGHRRWGLAVGQSMYAPEDLTLRTPDPADRPYAGWLYGSVNLVSEKDNRIDILEFDGGMIGPASLAGRTQTFVHELTNSTIPKGWKHQLHNEPGFVLAYQRKWRGLIEFSPFGLGADVTPYTGVNLGNVLTQAAAGATFRIGYDLPSDYGPPRARPSITGSDYFEPSRGFGWYLFAGVEGRAVARNIFLDGNTFRDSPHVSKLFFVGDAQVGAAMTIGAVRIAYTHAFMTQEYYHQKGHDMFGSFTVSARF